MSSPFDFSAIARQNVIIVQYATRGGNFDVTIGEMLKRQTTRDSQFAFEKGSHKYFVLRDDSGLNFIVVGPISTQQSVAFQFLQKVQRAFLINHPRKSWTDIPAYGMQNEFSDKLRQLMEAAASDNKLEKIRSNLEDTRIEMSNNLQQALLRNNDLSELNRQSELMMQEARTYERNATSLRRTMWWRRWQWWIIGIVIAVLVLAIIIGISVGSSKNK